MTAGLDDGALPIKVDPTSNGEFRPVPLAETVARANALALERIGEHAKRLSVARRTFLQSFCGAATTLLTLDEAFAAQDLLHCSATAQAIVAPTGQDTPTSCSAGD